MRDATVMNLFLKKINTCPVAMNQLLCEKCPYSELFWSAFSFIQTEYGPEQLRIGTLFTQWVKYTLNCFTALTFLGINVFRIW